MIELYHVFKSYDRKNNALSDITLDFDKGEFVFLTGPSGAGKTTLLRLIFREELPSRGHVFVNGVNTTTMPLFEVPYVRRQIGVVFQDFKLLRNRTVLENISFVPRLMGAKTRDRKQKALSVLSMVGLEHKKNAYPLNLSGGEQQRVAIARALVNDPIILLADEPTGNLDHELALEIMKLFLQINARGTTVLVASHNRELYTRFKRRIIVIEAGRVVDEGKESIGRFR
ncbi:cell division ATP-binding protein FtsE [Acidobacteriota bacterium]